MDDNRVADTVRNVGGKTQEVAGRVTGGGAGAAAEGVINQVKGTSENLHCQTRDSAAEAAGATRKSVSSFERFCAQRLNDSLTSRFLGTGCLMNPSHRPL